MGTTLTNRESQKVCGVLHLLSRNLLVYDSRKMLLSCQTRNLHIDFVDQRNSVEASSSPLSLSPLVVGIHDGKDLISHVIFILECFRSSKEMRLLVTIKKLFSLVACIRSAERAVNQSQNESNQQVLRNRYVHLVVYDILHMTDIYSKNSNLPI